MTSPPKLDARKIRADFPIFEQEFHGKPLAYLDSAATAQKPRQVLDALRTFYETSYANVHRGVYELSERSTAGYEGAREKLATFVNASSAKELIFTRNATEGLNLVAYAWGLVNLGPGDVVIVTELEHHSNFVPWQYVAKRAGADFRMIPLDDQGELDLSDLDGAAGDGNVRVVAPPGASTFPLTTVCISDNQSSRAARDLGSRPGRDHGRGRGPGGAAPEDRRAGARLRLSGVLLAQALRPDERRRAVGAA